MSDKRRVYKIDPIHVNDIKITHVVIDPHYEEKHSAKVNDRLILKLVHELDGRQEIPEAKQDQYSYFATLIEYESKRYRLIWMQEDNTLYVGVINAYRDSRRK